MDTEEVENKEDKRATDRLLNWRLALYDQLALPEISTQEILKIREAYQCLDLENKGFVDVIVIYLNKAKYDLGYHQ